MSEKKVSVNEFKNWLDGVLDFQPDDWVPNAEQWKKIRDKIDQLEDAPPQVASNAQQPAMGVSEPEPVHNKPAARNPRPSGPLSIDMDQKVKLPDTPPVTKQKHLITQKTGEARVIDSGSGQKIIDTGVTHKMENIDTSDGNYKSSFV